MRWNTPLAEAHAELLLERLAVESGSSVLDLGCGRGELLLRAVERAASEYATVYRGVLGFCYLVLER